MLYQYNHYCHNYYLYTCTHKIIYIIIVYSSLFPNKWAPKYFIDYGNLIK